jgi:hypothetical protein
LSNSQLALHWCIQHSAAKDPTNLILALQTGEIAVVPVMGPVIRLAVVMSVTAGDHIYKPHIHFEQP